jgi:hypothetical protein
VVSQAGEPSHTDQARLHRLQAQRARELAMELSTPEVIDSLLHYAEELEERAQRIERRGKAS